ncbi:MAG: biotin--[acetyl-CoA-carboxylase] ligase [Pseudomonadota bacterium]
MASTRLASGADLIVFDRLDSTNLEAHRRLAAGERGACWLLAREQTAGYGRRGAAWRAGRGDLAATLFAPAPTAHPPALVSFAAGLAVAEALDAFAGPERVALKWPNDVLLDGGKVAGLILEWIPAGGGRAAVDALVVGVGVNIVTRPIGLAYPAARLADAAEGVAAEDLLGRIDARLTARRADLTARGFGPLRAAWLDRAAGLRRRIRVKTPAQTLDGVFDGLDADGALLLRQQAGARPRRVAAGAVYFPDADLPNPG